jgi:hypothetical protein
MSGGSADDGVKQSGTAYIDASAALIGRAVGAFLMLEGTDNAVICRINASSRF